METEARIFMSHIYLEKQVTGSDCWIPIDRFMYKYEDGRHRPSDFKSNGFLTQEGIDELVKSGTIAPLKVEVQAVEGKCLHITPLRQVFYAFEKYPELDRNKIQVYDFNKF